MLMVIALIDVYFKSKMVTHETHKSIWKTKVMSYKLTRELVIPRNKMCFFSSSIKREVI